MQFLVYKSKNFIKDEMKGQIKKSFDERTSIICPHKDYEWISDDSTTLFIGRNPDLPIYDKYNTFNIDDHNNLTFIHGWLKKYSEDFLLDAKSINTIDDESELDGFYVVGNLQAINEAEFYCSAMFPHLYYAISDDSFAISNRISILSKIFNYEKPNKKHLASHIEYQHGPLTYDTMFENIYWIPYGTKIKINGDSLNFNKVHDFLYDDSLNKKYLENPKEYWNELYEKAISQTKAFINLGIRDNLTLGLSGGVDSRLLLSLYYPYLDSIFSGGPVYSPEVIVGRMVADTLNLHHTSPNPRAVSSSINLLKLLPKHLFAREFEMCPWDFGWVQERINPNIKIDGQEFIRTAPYLNNMNIEKIIEESKNRYTKVNFSNSINSEFINSILIDNENIMEEYLNNLHNINKFPTIQRMFSRGRWASRVHETIFDHSFHIYPLLSNVFLKYAYNTSVEDMFNQELVIEIFKRSCPELLNVPLFNKQFSQNPIPPIENKIPGKLNYKNLYLVRYFDFVKDFILSNFDLVKDIVNKDFIDNLTPDKVENNAKISQIIYNILQSIVLLNTDDFSFLKEELEIDIDFKEEEIEDTYDDDCISAFVQYNQDIVKLKQENIKLNEQIKNFSLQINDLNRNNVSDTDSENIKNKFNNEILKLKQENNALKEQIENLKRGFEEDKNYEDLFNNGISFFKLNSQLYSLDINKIENIEIFLKNNSLELTSKNQISKLFLKIPPIEEASCIIKLDCIPVNISKFELSYNNNIIHKINFNNVNQNILIYIPTIIGCNYSEELEFYFYNLGKLIINSIEIKKVKNNNF